MPLINRWCLILACALISSTPSAFAEISVSNYAEFKKNVPQFRYYLVGLGRGIFWTNNFLEMQGKPRLFCMPENLNLDDGIILSLIDQEIRSPSNKKPWDNKTTVEMVATLAFINRFPCAN